ncbi:MAG: DNA-binding response regulator [Crocinitomicaceae bacterium]|nr:DNA-binding response regulator [Crocinitomicaceae bacterium]
MQQSLLKDKKSIHILLVDDEQDIIDFLQYNLEREGYYVHTAMNGQQAVDLFQKIKPAMIIMDVMMPVMDGIEACYAIRKLTTFPQPIIAFLTSRAEDYSQVAGFEAGADDYISKPIRPRLLISKVEALLRRIKVETVANKIIEVGNVKVDRDRYIVVTAENEIQLPKKEFELLELLLSRPQKVFTREEILSTVWGNETIVGERTIDVHIRKLREKLGDDYIRTIKGVGYTFVDSEK